MNPENYRAATPSLYEYIKSETHRDLCSKASHYGLQALDSWYFHALESHHFDMQEIIRKSWQFACHVGSLDGPGSYVRVEIADLSLLVLMASNGSYRAYENICPHRGAPLVTQNKGHFNKRILCPFHGWSFELDGSLAHIPNWVDDFPHISSQNCRLNEFEVDVFEGFLFIKLGGQLPPPSETLAGFRELIASYNIPTMHPSYEVEDVIYEANWKLIMENDRNADHIPFIHPEYNDLFGSRGFSEVLFPHGVWHAALPVLERPGRLWTTRGYQKFLSRNDALPNAFRRTWMNFNIFPNFAFFLKPESADFMQIFPTSPTTSIMRSGGFNNTLEGREVKAARYLAGRIDQKVGNQDREMLEKVQRVICAGQFSSGPISATELGVQDYNRCLTDVYLQHSFGPLTELRDAVG